LALTGVFITWGYAAVSLFNQWGQATMLGTAVSSELMATGATSATSAPSNRGEALDPILSISASAPIYYVVGPKQMRQTLRSHDDTMIQRPAHSTSS